MRKRAYLTVIRLSIKTTNLSCAILAQSPWDTAPPGEILFLAASVDCGGMPTASILPDPQLQTQGHLYVHAMSMISCPKSLHNWVLPTSSGRLREPLKSTMPSAAATSTMAGLMSRMTNQTTR